MQKIAGTYVCIHVDYGYCSEMIDHFDEEKGGFVPQLSSIYGVQEACQPPYNRVMSYYLRYNAPGSIL